MIIKGSVVKTADNSGARVVKCIHVFKSKKNAKIGDLILISVKIHNPKKKIKKGEIYLSIVVRTKSIYKLYDRYINFSENSVVLINRKFLPLGTRMFGTSLHSIRFKNKKIFLMMQNII